ncbi:MAG TPA: DUF1810 domain-containing protein [Solirubrobacterales bacterium]|jgi:uncharacterized protein (DUF1810 family)
MTDFDLNRFITAQDSGSTYERALVELKAGRKASHWIWFVFPQIDGLGRSPTARAYAILSLEEARAYLEHPVLGPRLRECADALLGLDSDDPVAVMGPIDAVKLRSSMTLFARADPQDERFPNVLRKFHGAEEDEATLARLPFDPDSGTKGNLSEGGTRGG